MWLCHFGEGQSVQVAINIQEKCNRTEYGSLPVASRKTALN